ncbi:hypothetical protein KIH31_10480 [Paenarthrobacter sp. DKR-5]|uniref:DUF6541 family protein n=1 Tax=Paenarthrobacter sp. DKR-5 TaxID=2835535 RepID=UPI001BDCFA6D|nr:DUF6541 family protein [Paenarthrobacter sp. DKR-5]MBT1003034.1 hypothetical protein [Paenarthrobacter sp. DKR-5]
MHWSQTVPAALACVVIVFLPGAFLARIIGFRGLAWAGVSAPLTAAVGAGGAIALQLVHVRWSVAAFAVLTLASGVAAALARLVVLRIKRVTLREAFAFRRPSSLSMAAFVAGLATGAGIIGYRFIKIFGPPDNISQTFDNVFHLNAVRFILDTGRGSSLTLGALDPQSSAVSIYPGAWHDLVALVIEASGASIPVGVNVTNIVIAALVWPLSALFLVSRLTGARPAAMVVTGVLASGFASFPYLMVNFGVLYPNLLAIAILPAAIALVLDLLGLSLLPSGGRLKTIASLLLLLAGLALAHPSMPMAVFALSIAPLLAWLVLRLVAAKRSKARAWQYIWPPAAVVAYFLVLQQLWIRVRPSDNASFWPPTRTIPMALGEAVFSAPVGRPMPWVIAILTVAGVVVLLARRRALWLVGSFIISCGLYVVVSSFNKDEVRSFITGVWYNDSFRLAAMLPVIALPLAAVGAVWVIDRLRIWMVSVAVRTGRFPLLRPGWPAAATAALALGLLAVGVQGDAVNQEQDAAQDKYGYTSDAPLLTSEEHDLIGRLDREVPADALIVGDPYTGASLSYALADRQALMPSGGSPLNADEQKVIAKLRDVAKDPSVCPAVKRLRLKYVLDFGGTEVNLGNHGLGGIQNLDKVPGFEVVDSQGSAAKLYKITACGS